MKIWKKMVKKMKKTDLEYTRGSGSLPNVNHLEGHLLPMSAKFGRHPFPRLSVILFTERHIERQNDHITSVLVAEVTIYEVKADGRRRQTTARPDKPSAPLTFGHSRANKLMTICINF